METKLFVSHSSHSDVSKTRLRTVCQKLKDSGFFVLVDYEEIESGDAWRDRIHASLAECQAALILFDEEALRSPWVLKEATILSWRRALEKENFRLLPVRLGSVKKDDLDTKQFTPLLLNEIQHVVSGDADSIVAAVLASVKPGSGSPSLLELLVGDIATQLELLNVSDSTLEIVARQQNPDIKFTQGESRRAKFAELLARRLFRTGPACLSAAVDLLNALGSASTRSVIDKIAQLIAPLWVEPDAAALLERAFARSGDFQDLAFYSAKLRTFTQFAAEDYVRRAYLRSAVYTLLKVEEVSDGDEVNHVIERIRDHARKLSQIHSDDDDAETDEYINGEFTNVPAFAILPRVLDETELEQLRKKYPRLTFLMYTSESGQYKRTLCSRARYVVPELTTEAEKAIRAGRDRLEIYVKNLH